MMITTRPAAMDDRQRCIWIEDGAIRGIRYIDDVWPLFLGAGDGDLTLALKDGTLGGMGKLTHLYGGHCWLESLRVHPEFQNLGLGKAIYRRYFEEMAQRGLTACGMYTGFDNTHSRHLAELYGLSLKGRFGEYAMAVQDGDAPAFEVVAEADGEAVLAPHYGEMGGFAVLNRTWFPVRAGLGAEMARRGWLYRSSNGSLVVAGYRFQPSKALHVPFLHGDAGACLAFCHQLARIQGAAQLTAVRPYGEASEAAMAALGFEKTPHDLITLWKRL